MPHNLDPNEIVDTVVVLERRIRERFPERNLGRFAAQVVEIARDASERSEKLRRPIILLRLGVWLVVVAVTLVLIYGINEIRIVGTKAEVGELVQALEAAISSIVFLGAAGIFLFTLETRVKRRRALVALHELRGLAHVIDMHQLTKDPKEPMGEGYETASSPTHGLSLFELSRYLDYCSELLSIVNKLGALYARDFDDPVVLSSVDGLQRLADGLSQKIWHKINIVDRMLHG